MLFSNIFRTILCCFFILWMFSGCSSKSITENTVNLTDIQPILEEFDQFTLPEGYAFAERSVNTLPLLKEEAIIGGLVITDIDVTCLQERHCEYISSYIKSLTTEPLIGEYINMRGDSMNVISLSITDPETNERKEQIHYLFGKDGTCYDFWFDQGCISEDEGENILAYLRSN